MSYNDLLNTYQFERGTGVAIIQAKLDYFPDPLHQRIQIFRLGMTTWQGRHRGHVVAFFVAFDQDSELPLRLHAAILARL